MSNQDRAEGKDAIGKRVSVARGPSKGRMGRILSREFEGGYLTFTVLFDDGRKEPGYPGTSLVVHPEDDAKPFDALATPQAPGADEKVTGLDPDYILPCDVLVSPATVISKGCKLSTLVSSIKLREGKQTLDSADYVAVRNLARELREKADTPGGGGGEPVASLRQIIWAMRNWAGVAETCAVTEGHAPSCIRIWADMLEQLPAESSGGDAVDGYLVLVGYLDAGGDFMHAEMWARSDWATDSGYTTPVYTRAAIASGAEHGR